MKIKEKQLFNFLFANKGNLPNIGEYPSQFRFKTADTFFFNYFASIAISLNKILQKTEKQNSLLFTTINALKLYIC